MRTVAGIRTAHRSPDQARSRRHPRFTRLGSAVTRSDVEMATRVVVVMHRRRICATDQRASLHLRRGHDDTSVIAIAHGVPDSAQSQQ